MPSVCAIIVSYHSADKILANLSVLAPQIAHIVIVDNASDASTRACLVEAEIRWPGKLTVILNSHNLGLSKAQNMGIRVAIERGYKWALLLDDDSTPAEDMVARMLEHFLSLSEEDQRRVGILYPNIVDKHTLRKSVFLLQNHQRIRLSTCPDDGVIYPVIAMSSGSLIKIETFRQLGLMDEHFFIDQIDVDFSLRIISSGLLIIVVGRALLFHSLGLRQEFKIMGRTVTPTNHNAFRCYHIYRNRIIIWKRYIKSNPIFVIFDAFSSVYHLFKIIIFERNKFDKITNMIAGVFDGLLFGLKDSESEKRKIQP